MRTSFILGIALVLAANPAAQAGEADKSHTVGKDGLTIEGEVAATDAKVKVIAGAKAGQLPAKRYLVELRAGTKYRITLDSSDIDSVLVVQDKTGRQLAWDDDSGGGLNSLLSLGVLKDGVYQIYAASLKGTGRFTLKVREAGTVKVYDVGAGIKLSGALGDVGGITYLVTLETGKGYVIDMTSADPKALDPYLKLLDRKEKMIAEDNDGGGELNARITFQAEAGGIYRVLATRVGKGRGPFTLTVREAKEGERTLTAAEWGTLERAKQLSVRVVTLLQAGKAAEALGPGEEAVALRKEVQGVKHPDYVMTLRNLGYVYQMLGRLDKLEPLLRQTVDLGKEVLGTRHPHYAAVLYDLGDLYRQQGNLAKAEPLLVEALKVYGAGLGGERPDHANTLTALGLLYHAQGRYAKAEPLLVQARALTREVLGARHPDHAMSMYNLGALYAAQAQYAKAEPLLVQALALRKEILGTKHPDTVRTLSQLAAVYWHQDDYARAEPLFLQAVPLSKEVFGVNDSGYALNLTNLAALYYQQARYAKAEPLLLEALDLIKQAPSGNALDHALTLANLATLYETRGDEAQAERLLLQALDLYRANSGTRQAEYAIALNNLATFYSNRGNHAKAEPLLMQALQLEKEVLGVKHPLYAVGLHNLADCYEVQGDHARAESLLLESLDLVKEVQGTRHRAYAASLNSLAYFYRHQRNYARAEPLFRQALDVIKGVRDEKHPDYAKSLNNLAGLYADQGNYAKAEPLYRQALELHRDVFGVKHLLYVRSLNNLALLYKAQGDHAKAEALLRRAVVGLQSGAEPVPFEQLNAAQLRAHPDSIGVLLNLGRTLHTIALAERKLATLRQADHAFALALAMLERVRQEKLDQESSKVQLAADRFDLFADRIRVLHEISTAQPRPDELVAAFATAEQGSARAFLEALGSSRANRLAGVSAALQARESELLGRFRVLEQRIDKEASRPIGEHDPKLVRGLLGQRDTAEAQLKELVDRLEKDHPQYAGLKYPRPCTLAQARACLADDEIALLLVPGTSASYAVLIEARPQQLDLTDGLAIAKLPPAETLAEYVAALTDHETLARPARARALGREAYRAILGPCAKYLAGKHLVLVPGDVLGLLPFELLVDEQGKYLVETHRIRYAPSLTALHLIGLWKKDRPAPQAPLFALGDPVYGSALPRLVHSGAEVAAIAKLLGVNATDVLTGEAATEAALKRGPTAERLAQARYVHFATHGLLGVDRGRPPALVLSPSKGEDGRLELDEVANLKLNADLVVLSACRSGQGKQARGEGVSGLARAFLYAGSKGVVCSLWSVDDRETADFMVDFYDRMQKGTPTAEALRAARLATIRAGKAPLYWAPFILIGE